MSGVLFLFVDGIGLAPPGADNPLATAPLPALRALLGGPPTLDLVQRRDGVALVPLDATLGVPGLPQSATGQTSLFTGVNAAAALGRHVTALPGPRLRALLAEHSLLRRRREAGGRVTFANPYPAGTEERVRAGEVRAGATTWATLAAGVPLRGPAELARGAAVPWDVTGERSRHRFGAAGAALGLPIAPEEAGRRLAALAAEHELVLWETFLTDLAGHRRELAAEAALALVDGLLAGALAALPTGATLLLTSDHGNLEDATTRGHTRNPVPLLAVGPGAERLAAARSLLDVAPALLAGW
jgi:hypothetical protein